MSEGATVIAAKDAAGVPMSATGKRLAVTLPGVVSWSRPRRARGGVRYPTAYARSRDAWATVVASAVRDQSWTPAPTVRFQVEVTVHGGGKRDLDRVCTAVLDALQGGGALRDDGLVDELRAVRHRLQRRGRPATVVGLTEVPGARLAPSPGPNTTVAPTPVGAAERSS